MLPRHAFRYTIAQAEVLKPYGKDFNWELKAKMMWVLFRVHACSHKSFGSVVERDREKGAESLISLPHGSTALHNLKSTIGSCLA